MLFAYKTFKKKLLITYSLKQKEFTPCQNKNIFP